MWKPYHILVIAPQDSLEDLKTIAANYVNESLDKIVAENIDESSCKIEITSTRTYYFYKEKYLNETTILVEYPLICAVRVKCIYNSTAYWERKIYLYISPSTKQIIYAEIHDPYIEFKDIKGLINTMTTITAITISILLIIEIIIYEKYLKQNITKTTTIGQPR